LATLVRIK